jgi:hypothetical protein
LETRTWIGSVVGCRIDSLTAQEVVFDELEVGVEAQRLVVDVAVAGVRADGVVGATGRLVGARRVVDDQPVRRIDSPAGQVDGVWLRAGGRGQWLDPLT